MQKTMNRKLGEHSLSEIFQTMAGLVGTAAKKEAERLAKLHKVSVQHIYATTKAIRPSRKPRSDKGKRQYSLLKGPTREAFLSMVADKLNAEQALEDARINGHEDLPSTPTFLRILRENNVTGKQIASGKRSHRRFEAACPGEIYQVDVTGLKEGCWFDKKTRKVLRIPSTEINYNHPNTNKQLVKVWQIMLIDDHSRRKFLRYAVKDKLTSDDIVRFLLEAFDEMGLPKALYTDNGGEFKGRCVTAAILLNSLTKEDGGFQHIYHEPGNAQATGKVESAHKLIQAADAWIGKFIRIGNADQVSMEMLNTKFAKNVLARLNYNTVHRSTGQTPMERWNSGKLVSRKIDKTVLESALLSDSFEVKLDTALTVSRQGTVYQLPREERFQRAINQRITVVIPPDIPVILVKLPTEEDMFEVSKVVAVPDVAGEFKQMPTSSAQQLIADAKVEIKERQRAMRKGEIPKPKVMFIDVDEKVEKTNITPFPKKQVEYTAADIAAVAPVAAQHTSDIEIGYWEAIAEYSDAFSSKAEAKEFLLKLFGGADRELPKSNVLEAITNREAVQRRGMLRAV
jgi:hypothetical protein